MSRFSMKIATGVAVIGGIVAGAVTASAALNLPTMSCSYMFNTNMRLGSRGTDVMNLQKILNMYPQTQIASSGAGSPGMETSTFGPATRAAVNKFQALHLAELGVTAPTGNVFAGTRGLLNMVCNGTVSTTPTTPGNVVTGPVSAMLGSSQPTGMLVAGQAGARLAEITLTGNGTVNSIELQRTGVSSDSALTNVYLYDGNIRITDAASVVTGGYIRFNAGAGLFTVNGTRMLTVRADIASGTSGQSVGVKLNSITAGGAVSTYTNVMGNMLQIGSATPATVNFSTITTSNTQVDAGTQAYKLWEGTASVGTRDVRLKAATFKFVGSAPVDAVANVALFVDGAKVAGPAMIDAANNNKLSFSLTGMGELLRSGSHTLEVRGDIVKGSNRTMTFSVENVADLMFEDTSLAGVNVAATVATAALTQTNSTYRTITVNKGSVTVSIDPAYTASKVTGGAANVPVGQFTLKAYGEDVKVNSLTVTPSLSSAAPFAGGLPNVSLYVNGGQIGTSQNWSSGALSFNLGSSLIIPANTTVTLTVKADIVNATSSAAYTAGSLSVQLGGASNNAQGQSSNELVDVAASAVTSNSLTVSSGAGTFGRVSGFTAVTLSPNSPNTKIGSFTLSADSSESLRVNTIGVKPTVATYAITNISNLTVKSDGVAIGSVIGNPAAGTSTFSFSDIVISANASKTFDVYADIGSGPTGSVTTDMAVTYRGSISNTTTVSSAAGVAITSAASALATSTVNPTPVAQYVVGGVTYGIATYKLYTASAGTVATVDELDFVTTGTDAIESITVGGVTRTVNLTGTTTIPGLNIAINSTGKEVPVTVKFSGFRGSALGGGLQASIPTVYVTLSRVQARSGSGSGSVITNVAALNSATVSLVGSKPTVTMNAGNTDTLVLGAENKVGEFTVAADSNGDIAIATSTFSLSATGVTGVEFTSPRLADGNSTISSAPVTGSSTMVVHFNSGNYPISAGQSKTFSLYAIVSGTAQTGITPYASSRFASSTGFVWRDILGGNSVQTGANIYGFPTTSFTSKR